MSCKCTGTPVAAMTEWKKTHSAAAADEVVEAAAGVAAKERFRIQALFVNGDTEGSLEIKDSSGTSLYTFYYGANGGIDLKGMDLRITQAKGFKYVQVGGGNYQVVLKYEKTQVETGA